MSKKNISLSKSSFSQSSKIQLLVLCGGQSSEHEVSLISAKNIVAALDANKYDIRVVVIKHNGEWLLLNSPQQFLELVNNKKLLINSFAEKVNLIMEDGKSTLMPVISENKKSCPVDVAFPVFHGVRGEDGAVQGLLELANLPYVGPAVLGSAICMDKDVSKRLLRDAGIPIADFIVVHRHQVPQLNFDKIVQRLGLPCFVKPANTGSSVGISKIKTIKDFPAAIELALQYDNKIIFEQFIQGREIECAILGNEKPEASLPGEVVPHHEFYTYEAKYLDPNGADLIVPAHLPPDVIKKIQEMAKQAFVILNCEGMARVDFFVTAGYQIYLNEINTIPGFTTISMYPKLWMASGLSYSELLDKLIDLAMERFARNQKLVQDSGFRIQDSGK